MKKKISLFGATGSIGIQTIDIIESNPDKFKLVSFSAGMNIEKVREITTLSTRRYRLLRREDAERLKQNFQQLNLFMVMKGLLK